MIYILLSSVIGGFLNRLRGGLAYDLGFGIPHGIMRIIVSLFSTVCLYFPFWQVHAFNSIDYIWFTGVFLAAFAIGIIPGWGSWFKIGRNPNSYKHNRDWILSEYLSYLRYGPKWAIFNPHKPNHDETHFLHRFNIIPSPTGQIRPFKWRVKMERFAMNVRGLNFTVAAPLVFAAHLYFQYDYKLFGLLFLLPTGYLMGYLYEVRYFIKRDLPSWFNGSTQLGEFLCGASIMSSFLMGGSYLALSLTI